MKINVNSEIGKLNGVILHTPGKEVANMNPSNAHKALYSDILNLPICLEEYAQLEGVLNKITNVFKVEDLLSDILKDNNTREILLKRISEYENLDPISEYLASLEAKELANHLLEGVLRQKKNFTNYFDQARYDLNPLPNFFFTRDASMTVGNSVLIGKMASEVRAREAVIMKTIFDFHPEVKTTTYQAPKNYPDYADLRVEGGDVLIARDDILLIGLGLRTSPQGIDFIIDNILKNAPNAKHIIVQELPKSPESFIHLDMVFTLLDHDKCMVYEPVILKNNQYRTIHLTVENQKIKQISDKENILVALKELGMDLKPISCGGTDAWIQEREQWHSGANFFTVAPGKIMGYERNTYTIEELAKNGFEVLKANDVIADKVSIDDYKSCVITLEGSELARGGGGCRCMTMPISRD